MARIQWLFLLILIPVANLAFAVNKTCEDLLGPSAIIRHFRKPFDTTRTGTWYNLHGRMVFVPHDSKAAVIKQPMDKNTAAHLAILERQMGVAALDEAISSSSSPQEGMERVLQQQQAEMSEEHLDLDALLAEVSAYPSNVDLPQALEDKIMTALRHFERLATPMVDWLRPKVLSKRLGQLPNSSFTDNITTWISPTVKVHKANLVTVRLNGIKQFVLSSSFYASPDSYHRSSMAFLSLILPESRLVEKERPGYLVIKAWDETLLSGQIQFVTKGNKEVLFRESYDYTK